MKNFLSIRIVIKYRSNNVAQSERKAREDTEEAILDTLRTIVSKTKFDIQSEQKEREMTEETLLLLLEESCQKLSTSII